jgi:hypothetical protein
VRSLRCAPGAVITTSTGAVCPTYLTGFRDLDGRAGEASRVDERAAGREHEDQEKSEQIPHVSIISESLPSVSDP